MRDWYNLEDMKLAMLDTLLEMKDDAKITDYAKALIERFEKEDGDASES